MPQAHITVQVRRVGTASIIDIQGEVDAFAEEALTAAYHKASDDGTKAIVLNFSELEYMNSSGIGLLVTLLIRARRQEQRLLAYGLTDHYRQIFELTRLNEAIILFDGEAEALVAARELLAQG